MASWIRRGAAMLLLAGFAVLCAGSGVAADDKNKNSEETPDAKTIMKKVNGKKGLTAKMQDAIKSSSWEEAQKLGKELKDLGAALGKAHPNGGEKDSWEKLTKKYAENTKAMADAADKKDAKAFGTAYKTFSGACKTCHDQHK